MLTDGRSLSLPAATVLMEQKRSQVLWQEFHMYRSFIHPLNHCLGIGNLFAKEPQKVCLSSDI